MVKGLELFREHFAGYADQYVLIGGTAATLAMEAAGLPFRATKDLDIVLHIEALGPAFGAAFWKFIGKGAYEIRQVSEDGKPLLYRFQKPADSRYPAMLELFCRSPDGIQLSDSSHFTPIPFDESVASLSAILLDDAYYAFIIGGRKEVDGLAWIDAEQLIPLKARAWLDLSARKASGQPVDSKDIRKHANDVVRLSQLLPADTAVHVVRQIADDLTRFLDGVANDGSFDPKTLGIENTFGDIVDRIARAYGVRNG